MREREREREGERERLRYLLHRLFDDNATALAANLQTDLTCADGKWKIGQHTESNVK